MRRWFLFMIAGMTGCFSPSKSQAVTPAPAGDKGSDGDKPNVLFIIMDDMCDWAGYLGGHPQSRTPNLDRLAQRGVSFLNAYTTVPFSNPSRAAILTGLPPTVTGIYQNAHELQASPAAEACIYMPEHFHRNGYYTLWAGKVFHNRPTEERLAAMWDDQQCKDGGYGPWSHGIKPARGIDWHDYEEYQGPDTDIPDVVNTQHVVEFLGRQHDKPFFAALGLYRPHAPYTVPKRYFDRFDASTIRLPLAPADDLDDIPQYALDNFMPPVCDVRDLLPQWKASGYWSQLARAYLASVSFADDMVGRVLDALDKSPYAKNTIVVLIGDNGFHQGQKQRFSKMALWREACHVPFIVYRPGGPEGRVSSPVSLIDIYHTLVSMCGLPGIASLYGNDLSPVVGDPAMLWDKPCWSNYIPGNFAVHYRNWNYIRYRDYASVPGSHELYNIDTDEDELHNLANDEANHALIDRIAGFIPGAWVPAVTDNPQAGRTISVSSLDDTIFDP